MIRMRRASLVFVLLFVAALLPLPPAAVTATPAVPRAAQTNEPTTSVGDGCADR
jgi:hypothetical protein